MRADDVGQAPGILHGNDGHHRLGGDFLGEFYVLFKLKDDTAGERLNLRACHCFFGVLLGIHQIKLIVIQVGEGARPGNTFDQDANRAPRDF